MSLIRAMREGLGRALAAPRLVLALWVASFVVALPLAVVVGGAIQESVGESLVHRNLVEGFDTGWFGEFEAAAEGLPATLRPSIVGAGAFFDNLEAWWSGGLAGNFPGLVGVGVLYALLWAFLLGGVLQWMVRPDGFEGGVISGTFFSGCGRFFFRFVRLALLSGVLYFLIYRFARWLFRRLEWATRDVTSESTVLVWVLAAAALVVLLLVLVRVVSDYAKVMMATENRYGVLLTAWAAVRFVAANPVRTLGLYGGIALLWVVILALYALVAPGPGQSTWLGVILAFVVGQGMLILRLGLRVSLLGGETALYRSVLEDERRAAKAAA